jgi:hypothetical protein
LRSTSDLRCSTKLDLEKIYVVQKVHDKTGLGYIESLPSSVSKDTGSPKENVEQSKKSESKTDNVKNAKDNRRKYNHTYQYKYSNRKNRNNNYHQRNRDTFNPYWSNKIYFRDPDGWCYELKNQGVSQDWTQRNESQKDIPQHAHKSNTFVNNKNKFSNNSRTRAQELKNHY